MYTFIGYAENHHGTAYEDNDITTVRIVGVFTNCADAIRALPCPDKYRSSLTRHVHYLTEHPYLLTWEWKLPPVGFDSYNYTIYKIVVRKIIK